MFINLGNGEYVNLDNIARCDFKNENNKLTATIYFSKTGGADRHFVYNEYAQKLQDVLNKLEFGYVEPAPVKPVKKKWVKK